MNSALLVAASLILGAALFFVLFRPDRHRRPAWTLLFPLAGALSVPGGLVLYSLVNFSLPTTPGPWRDIVFIWTVNAPVEEAAKYLCFALVVACFRTIRRPQDGLSQGAATGLGFALVENLLYSWNGDGALWWFRSLVSLPGHLIYGAVWGGYHGFEVYQGRGRVGRWWVPLLALVPAIFSHAVFNTLIVLKFPWALALVVDGLTLGFGLFLFFQLRNLAPHSWPLSQWRTAIPHLEHALALDPRSPDLRRRLAAYLLAASRPREALTLLGGLNDPWSRFYALCAARRLHPQNQPLPPEASLNPRLFQRLSGD